MVLPSLVTGGGICLPFVSRSSKSFVLSSSPPFLFKSPLLIHLTRGPWFFCLGGKFRECSSAEFAWRMGIYEEHETRSPIFELFLRSAAREYLSGASGYDFCGTIANRAFHSSVSQESHIKSLIHRLLHRLITFSIKHKRHGDKFKSLNLFFLWSIVT